MKISTIICTYNPNDSYLIQCLNAIEQAATLLPISELIIVDNNSTKALIDRDCIKKLSDKENYVKVVREERQGLTFARLKAIEIAKGDLLIFIDDDNIIHENFFESAADIFHQYPFIGSFSGQVLLEFEQDPPKWSKRYWGLFVQRIFQGNRWSNIPSSDVVMPCGAGLCVRQNVALHYAHLHNSGQRKIILDRSERSLMSGGDNDLALCAIDIGLGMGLFESLKLNHLIPGHRLTKKYILALAYSIAYSSELLYSMRGKLNYDRTKIQWIKSFLIPFTMLPYDAKVYRACERAKIHARKTFKEIHTIP